MGGRDDSAQGCQVHAYCCISLAFMTQLKVAMTSNAKGGEMELVSVQDSVKYVSESVSPV
jgi:hypothetical protein